MVFLDRSVDGTSKSAWSSCVSGKTRGDIFQTHLRIKGCPYLANSRSQYRNHGLVGHGNYALRIDLDDSVSDSNAASFADTTAQKATNLKHVTVCEDVRKSGIAKNPYHSILDAKAKLILRIWSPHSYFHHRRCADNSQLDSRQMSDTLKMQMAWMNRSGGSPSTFAGALPSTH